MLGQTFQANGNYYRVKNNLLIKTAFASEGNSHSLLHFPFGASKAATTFIVRVNNTSKFKVN